MQPHSKRKIHFHFLVIASSGRRSPTRLGQSAQFYVAVVIHRIEAVVQLRSDHLDIHRNVSCPVVIVYNSPVSERVSNVHNSYISIDMHTVSKIHRGPVAASAMHVEI